MKSITQGYKDQIKTLGKEIDAKVTYTIDNEEIELGAEEINNISFSYEGSILKSVMKKLDIDVNEQIPVGTIINYQFGLKVNGSYEYIDYGNFIVKEEHKQEDTRSYQYLCYDKMLYAMKEYNGITATFPMTLRTYIGHICSSLDLTFKNANETFANYNKQLDVDYFVDANGTFLGYTFRDVLDQIAEVTASTICINDDGELEIRYINDTPGINQYVNSENLHFNTVNVQNGAEDLETYDNYSNVVHIKQSVAWCTIKNQLYSQYYFDNIGPGGIVSVLVLLKKVNPNVSVSLYFGAQMTTGYVNLIKYKDVDDEWAYYYATYTFKNNATNFNSNFHFSTGGEVYIAKIQVSLGENLYDYVPYGVGDTINEEYLNDVNVKFGEKYGPINSIVLSRSAGADNIYLKDEASIEQNGLCEIKIEDNQIMSGNNRDEFLPDILNALDGLEYYLNNFSSTGITYYDLCDRYNIKVFDKTYSCIMFNDEINVNQGLQENIYTERMKDSESDYSKADKTDRKINQAYAMIDKQNGVITNFVSQTTQTQELNNQRILDLTQRTNSVEQRITSTEASIEVIEQQVVAGQQTVKNSLVTIDVNGINVSTNTSAIATLMTNEKFVIRSGDRYLAYFGYDNETNSTKAEMDNLTVTNYFIAGYHRIEKIKINGEKRTGYFYIGGDN